MVSPAFPGLFFAFAAMTLLLFASVSSPVWDRIYFLKAVANNQEIRWGVFGRCILNGMCSKASLGYDLSLPGVEYVAAPISLTAVQTSTPTSSTTCPSA